MQNILLTWLIVAGTLCAVTVIYLLLHKSTEKTPTSKAHKETSTPISQRASYRSALSGRDTVRLAFSAVLWGAVVPYTMYKLTKPKANIR